MRPLLKWAGGKRQLLPALREFYPPHFDRYVEPFVGSGAVFFDLYAAGRLDGRAVLLTDANPDLVGCYEAVRDDPDAVIAALSSLEAEHLERGSACYYEVRDDRFNPARAGDGPRNTPALAAMFIYLNRTGFNGLFRLNRQGGFNVPAGRYDAPRICDADHIRTVARALGARGVMIRHAPFDDVLSGTGHGDFVYCDPPYAPLSRTASFAHYTAGGFTAADQVRLTRVIIAAARRGAAVLVSNSSAPEIAAAFAAPGAQRAGLTLRRVPARRAINSRASGRGPIDELLVTNVSPLADVPIRMAKAPIARTRATRAANS